LPQLRKTRRDNLTVLVATIPDVRSANLMDLAASLPREAQRVDMRDQWIAAGLGNPLIDADAVTAPFAADPGGSVALDQSEVSERHPELRPAVRQGGRDRFCDAEGSARHGCALVARGVPVNNVLAARALPDHVAIGQCSRSLIFAAFSATNRCPLGRKCSKQTCVGRPTLRPLRLLFDRRFLLPNR
jgi:hypothetical protein